MSRNELMTKKKEMYIQNSKFLFVIMTIFRSQMVHSSPLDPALGRGAPIIGAPIVTEDNKDNHGFMKDMDFQKMFQIYRQEPSMEDSGDKFNNMPQESRSENGEFNLPSFGVPAKFRGGFDSIDEFSGPFGGNDERFASFLNSVNQKAFEREEFKRPQPVYKPKMEEDETTPSHFSNPLKSHDFPKFQNMPKETESPLRVFNPEDMKKPIIRPIPSKSPVHSMKPHHHQQQSRHQNHNVQSPNFDRFRPITKETSKQSTHDFPMFDNTQEIITAAPLSKRRFVSAKRGQTFDVQLGAGFNTRDGVSLDRKTLEPIRPNKY